MHAHTPTDNRSGNPLHNTRCTHRSRTAGSTMPASRLICCHDADSSFSLKGFATAAASPDRTYANLYDSGSWPSDQLCARMSNGVTMPVPVVGDTVR